MEKIENRAMDKRAIMEILDAVHATVEKYHGSETARDARVSADYAATVFFGLCDMGLHKLDKNKRRQEYEQIVLNLKTMAETCAESGIKGLTSGIAV